MIYIQTARTAWKSMLQQVWIFWSVLVHIGYEVQNDNMQAVLSQWQTTRQIMSWLTQQGQFKFQLLLGIQIMQDLQLWQQFQVQSLELFCGVLTQLVELCEQMLTNKFSLQMEHGQNLHDVLL